MIEYSREGRRMGKNTLPSIIANEFESFLNDVHKRKY